MTNIWFTADHHFGHANIIGFCNRPFSDVMEMDAELMRRWREHQGE
jgi:calcineurin-like phosphoesterase family protein